jgi:hypothetical protein
MRAAGSTFGLPTLPSRATWRAEAVEKLAVVPGVPAISVAGTKYEHASKNDLLDVYKLYMKSKMRDAGDAMPPALDADLQEVCAMLALPEQKAADARAVLVSDSYQKILKDTVLGGRLDEAESPAAVLNELITQVRMPGEQVCLAYLRHA